MIIGWGVDPETQQKFWIIRNSYGPTWGMGGDFMMKRGTDEFGIESEQIGFDPILL